MATLVLSRLYAASKGTQLPGGSTSSMLYPNHLALALDLLAASASACVFAGVYAPNNGVRTLLRSFNLRQVCVRWYWFLIAVALYPAVLGVGNLISVWTGQAMSPPRNTGVWYQLLPIMVLSFAMALLYGGGLEEPGWRGFALPHLQARYSPTKASLILAVIWAFWH
jgi:membrane protease YdiL (CAAX protease family)